MSHSHSTEAGQPLHPLRRTLAEVIADLPGRNGGPPLTERDTEENFRALDQAALAARKAGVTADDPLLLLSFAQSAAARDVDGVLNADLHYAMCEMKTVVSASQPSLSVWRTSQACTSTFINSLPPEDQSKFAQETFDLCRTRLSQRNVLARHSLLVDTVFVLHNTLYDVANYSMNDAGRAKQIVEGMEQVWANMYLSRELLLGLSSARWHLAQLSLSWTNMCWNLKCLPEWETDTYWLFFFLWMKQSKTEICDTLIVGMHSMDCHIGSSPFAKLVGHDLSQRLYEIMKKATKLYGEDALLARFREILEDQTMPHDRLRLALKHVSHYAPHTLGSKLHSSGILHLYLRESRRQQADGQWELQDARALSELAHNVSVQAGYGDMQQQKMMGVLIEQEHFMRDFMLPALRMGLENNLWITGGPEDEHDAVPEQWLVYLTADTAEMYKSSAPGSSGHRVMSALRTEVSPYWHRFDAVMQTLPARGYELPHRKQELIKSWRRLGVALQLDPRRAPRQLEAPDRATQTFCDWPLCQYHDQEPPHALKACSGCGEARYCSKGCQSSDWKLNNHKARCRRIKK